MNQSESRMIWIVLVLTVCMGMVYQSEGSPDAKRLYDDLLRKSGYNKLIRPVSNTSNTLVVKLGLRLTQIIDVDEKNQIMTTNVWLEQEWYDYKLMWEPANYGGVDRIYVPSMEIWLPDIVLYNSADGNFTVKLMTKATIYYNGKVAWKPPAIYQSYCPIDVEFFPFDEQLCTLKIGSWSYDGYSVDIKHKVLTKEEHDLTEVPVGIDLGDYYSSTEWDLLAVPAKKYVKYYPCCSEPFPDIKFNITIRRKTLFYTVNLILPCVAICSVTLLVFYIPASSGEKITMGITILNSLNIFLLLVAEINPPTSIATPLIGKYLLFTMVLVTCSIIVTVFVLNIHFRSPSTHVMSPWIRELFLNVLPRLLLMRRPHTRRDRLPKVAVRTADGVDMREPFRHSNSQPQFRATMANHSRGVTEINIVDNSIHGNSYIGGGLGGGRDTLLRENGPTLPPPLHPNRPPESVMQAMIGVSFIADHLKQQDEFNRDEKNQIMTTNVWLEQQWYDYKLTWHPEHYGGVERLYVPSNEIWLPDIVLYNSADGNFTVKLMTKATIIHTGLVTWNPPAIYKSLCPIDVEFFPFDEQLCTLKIGSWTYDGFSVDIKHNGLPDHVNDLSQVEKGIGLSDYYSSTEWDLLAVPAKKYEKYYPCCSEPFPDIKFNITIRRKTLFYTVNLILPCVAICSVTLLVFYIPANSGEKITMGITILNSLNIFLLLVAEINPPTSLATPLIGKYLLFTMVLVTCSIIVTVFVLNIHFRSPSTHVMSPWIRELFLNVLPRLLLMRRPQTRRDKLPKVSVRTCEGVEIRDPYGHVRQQYAGTTQPNHGVTEINIVDNLRGHNFMSSSLGNTMSGHTMGTSLGNTMSRERDDLLYHESGPSLAPLHRPHRPPDTVMQAMIGVSFIADHLKQQDEFNRVKQDWQFVAMVLDRLFLWIFTAACIVGTFGIIVQAPTLYDTRVPLG